MVDADVPGSHVERFHFTDKDGFTLRLGEDMFRTEVAVGEYPITQAITLSDLREKQKEATAPIRPTMAGDNASYVTDKFRPETNRSILVCPQEGQANEPHMLFSFGTSDSVVEAYKLSLDETGSFSVTDNGLSPIDMLVVTPEYSGNAIMGEWKTTKIDTKNLIKNNFTRQSQPSPACKQFEAAVSAVFQSQQKQRASKLGNVLSRLKG